MLKKLSLIVLAVLVSLYVSGQVNAQERIRNFDTSVEIRKDGSIRVMERILYDFGSAFRHGIYRDIPSIVYRENNDKYVLKYKVETVTDDEGNAYQFSLLNPSDHLRIKIGDPNRTISGSHTYIITYEVRGALTYLADHTELYWNGTGDQWDVPIDAAVTRVRLPKPIFGDDLKLACYAGRLGSTESACTTSSEGSVEVFTATRPLLEKEGLTVVVGFPKNVVAVLQAQKYVAFFDRWYGKAILVVVIMLAFLWFIVYPIWIVVKWLRYGRDPKPMMGETRAWYEPPSTTSHSTSSGRVEGRALTPGETGSLLDESVDNRDISAMIVDLARRGYIKIEEREKKDFYLIKTKLGKNTTQLMKFEQTFLTDAFESTDELRIKDSKLYVVIEKIKAELYEQMLKDGFFAKNPSKTRLFYVVIIVLGFITFNIPLATVAILFGLHMTKKTQLGSDASAVGRSLKNFLSSQERQLTFQASKQMMFEKLLPFAVAFGVEKLWADRFKDINLKQPDWYSSRHKGAFNSAVFISSLDSSLKSVSVASQPPRSSSGSGFSGGFSGGGGGGGGGGSW